MRRRLLSTSSTIQTPADAAGVHAGPQWPPRGKPDRGRTARHKRQTESDEAVRREALILSLSRTDYDEERDGEPERHEFSYNRSGAKHNQAR